MSLPTGYSEIEHTADWALHIWAPDLPGLLQTAAEGMFGLMGVGTGAAEPDQYELTAEGTDAETLLVAFLSEILRIAEDEGLRLAHFDLQIDGYQLSASAQAHRISRLDKEIKAVTFHNLAVTETETGVETTIVFDV